MNILHAISSVNPGGGGPIEGIKQLSRFARTRGHRVEIVCMDSPDAPWVKSFGDALHPLGPGKGKYSFSGRFTPWLKENASRFDVVVVNGLWQYHSLGTWRALRKRRTPYAVFTHGMLDPWFKERYPVKHLKKWLYWPWGDYRVVRDASAVFFTCSEERLLARKSFWLYKANEVVINYGTADPPGDLGAQQGELEKRFPLLSGKRVALFLGRIHPKKACDLVIKAFASELCRDPSWHLVMAGPDQTGWQSELEELASALGVSNRITWAGHVGGALKWGLLRASEILVLPSHQENFGIVVAEALSCSTPVLISKKVNIWREVQADGAGFATDDNLGAFSECLRRWTNLSDEEKLTARKCARRCFEDRFEVTKAGEQFLSALARIAADGKQRQG